MQSLFTYGGSRKSGITPKTILGGNRSRFGAYSPTYAYDSAGSIGDLPLSPEAATAMADVQSLNSVSGITSRISEIDSAIANLTLFESQVRAYYDGRVNRTSGGKRDRLRRERSDLCNQANAEIALLRSARASAVRRATAVATSTQDDYNPNTGKTLTPTEKEAVAAGKMEPPSNMSSLLIPVGAAVAALFFLKGN